MNDSLLNRLRRIGARPVDLIMVLDSRTGRELRMRVLPRNLAMLGTALVALVFTAGWMMHATTDDFVDEDLARQWRAQIDAQQAELTALEAEAHTSLGALRRRFGELQARLVRMEAVGERVAGLVDVDAGEFDFRSAPSIGGPEPTADEALEVQPPAFIAMIEQLSERLLLRQQELSALETMIDLQMFAEEVSLDGRPVDQGWLSSAFGRRVDPIDGQLAWHKGIDFAGDEGDPIITVASGVVTYAGRRAGYGNLVEVNHGNGYMTRYGHAREVLVSVGEVVNKGEQIAVMGSTGRSTGPHVHFEVLLEGEQVDPATYVARDNP